MDAGPDSNPFSVTGWKTTLALGKALPLRVTLPETEAMLPPQPIKGRAAQASKRRRPRIGLPPVKRSTGLGEFQVPASRTGDHFAANDRGQGAEDDRVGVPGQEADRAVAQHPVRPVGVEAAPG